MAFDFLWTGLTVLAALAFLVSAASLAQGVRLRVLVRRAMRMAFGAFLPSVVLVLPVRGLDEGFDANVRALLSQEYPRYRVMLVADAASDPAAGRAQELAAAFPRARVTVVISDPSSLPGKVNALRSALAHLVQNDEVVVFADSDIRPASDWLRQLVQPLADSTVGVATGFRWYVPPTPTLWSLIRAEWNGVSANVLFDPKRTFAWGGSCAVRRDTLPWLRLEERWRGVLSDDLVLTQAVREAGLRIAYAPAALVGTHEGADRATCIEWCLRQMSMATLYLPIVRRYAAAAFAVFDGSILFGLACLAMAIALGPAYLIPAALFLAPLPTAIVKAALRRRALFSTAPAVGAAWNVPAWRAAAAALVVPWLMGWGLVRTRGTTTIRWRGRTYDVRDPQNVRFREENS
ncbi:MAG: glycosyltransferase family 2 protein [Thermoplasmata archaeon]|nr:glycosyltransferase family 2 protein [Thermoplasmata archaeon]